MITYFVVRLIRFTRVTAPFVEVHANPGEDIVLNVLGPANAIWIDGFANFECISISTIDLLGHGQPRQGPRLTFNIKWVGEPD